MCHLKEQKFDECSKICSDIQNSRQEAMATVPIYWWTIGGILGAVLEVACEISENLPSVIINFRAGGMSRDYYGDAVINAFGDWIAALLGYYACVLGCERYGLPLKTILLQSLIIFLAMKVSLLIFSEIAWD